MFFIAIEEEKEKIIKKELKKYQKMYAFLDKNRQEFAKKLYKEAVFMQFRLDELKGIIEKDGSIKLITNGNGIQTKQEHPALKAYNVLIKNYNQTMKNLLDLLPSEITKDELMEHIK